ncbi:MAG: hypothetical protein WDZ62_01930 [Candidatus Pacearchaeota archaeon]
MDLERTMTSGDFLDSEIKNILMKEELFKDFSYCDFSKLTGREYLSALNFVKEEYKFFRDVEGDPIKFQGESTLTGIYELPSSEWLKENEYKISSIFTEQRYEKFKKLNNSELQKNLDTFVSLRNIPELDSAKEKAIHLVKNNKFLGTVHDKDFVEIDIYKHKDNLYCIGGIYHSLYIVLDPESQKP